VSDTYDRERMRDAFAALLDDHFAGSGEAALRGAYELGRHAVQDGFGVLDLEEAYREALDRALAPALDADEARARSRMAAELFAESLSPFEMVHRRVQMLNVELEQRVKDRTADLEAANGELETFSYSVSHDLRAPLRAIAGFSQALLDDYKEELDDEGRDLLNRVRAASARMTQLIEDILKLSRVTRAEMRRDPVDLSALAQTVAKGLEEAEPDRRVDFLIAGGIGVNGDAALLRIVLENLLGNAWKFTGHRPHAQIEFGATKRNGSRVCFVRDNGAGFDMDRAGSLFGAFQRLHCSADFPGTGIGLATVQRIVRRHGGEIWAESAVDKGATFFFVV
jgi:light-regulated signal transduction histidine kinase (bacteriophytochrome)